jgi:hypothetical protein
MRQYTKIYSKIGRYYLALGQKVAVDEGNVLAAIIEQACLRSHSIFLGS